MFRYLLSFMAVLLTLRFVIGLARMLGSGSQRPRVEPEKPPEAKPPSRYDASNAIDVPFTEIPPETPR